MSNQEEIIIQLFRDHMSDLKERGLQGIASYYHEPSLLITPEGVSTLASKKDLEVLFKPVLEELKSQG